MLGAKKKKKSFISPSISGWLHNEGLRNKKKEKKKKGEDRKEKVLWVLPLWRQSRSEQRIRRRRRRQGKGGREGGEKEKKDERISLDAFRAVFVFRHQ